MHATYLGWVELTLYQWKYSRKSLWKIEKKNPQKMVKNGCFFFIRKAKTSSFDGCTVTNYPSNRSLKDPRHYLCRYGACNCLFWAKKIGKRGKFSEKNHKFEHLTLEYDVAC